MPDPVTTRGVVSIHRILRLHIVSCPAEHKTRTGHTFSVLGARASTGECALFCYIDDMSRRPVGHSFDQLLPRHLSYNDWGCRSNHDNRAHPHHLKRSQTPRVASNASSNHPDDLLVQVHAPSFQYSCRPWRTQCSTTYNLIVVKKLLPIILQDTISQAIIIPAMDVAQHQRRKRKPRAMYTQTCREGNRNNMGK